MFSFNPHQLVNLYCVLYLTKHIQTVNQRFEFDESVERLLEEKLKLEEVQARLKELEQIIVSKIGEYFGEK